jgi:hypothetical protein
MEVIRKRLPGHQADGNLNALISNLIAAICDMHPTANQVKDFIGTAILMVVHKTREIILDENTILPREAQDVALAQLQRYEQVDDEAIARRIWPGSARDWAHCAPDCSDRGLGIIEDGRGNWLATFHFPSPLIEWSVPVSDVRLCEWLHREAHGAKDQGRHSRRSTPRSSKMTLDENRRVPRPFILHHHATKSRTRSQT